MAKKHIHIYANLTLKRRIELAATKHQVAVTEYCLYAITQQLADDDLLEEEQIAIPVKPSYDETLLADLRALREKIKARRGGNPIPIDRILERMRDERDYELSGVR